MGAADFSSNLNAPNLLKRTEKTIKNIKKLFTQSVKKRKNLNRKKYTPLQKSRKLPLFYKNRLKTTPELDWLVKNRLFKFKKLKENLPVDIIIPDYFLSIRY